MNAAHDQLGDVKTWQADALLEDTAIAPSGRHAQVVEVPKNKAKRRQVLEAKDEVIAIKGNRVAVDGEAFQADVDADVVGAADTSPFATIMYSSELALMFRPMAAATSVLMKLCIEPESSRACRWWLLILTWRAGVLRADARQHVHRHHRLVIIIVALLRAGVVIVCDLDVEEAPTAMVADILLVAVGTGPACDTRQSHQG